MAHIEHSQAVIEAAKQLGVQLGSGEDFDPSDALQTLGDELTSFAGDLTPVKWNDDPDDPFAGEDDPWETADFGGFSFKKLGRGIVKGIKKVARNPIVQVLNPALAISAHTTNKALGGKAIIKGPLGRVVDAGSAGVMKIVPMGNAMGELGKKAAGVTKMLPIKQAAAAIKSTANVRGVVSFGVPSNGNVKSAMASADRLLGSRDINNAALVVRNTKALAALGDPAAKRGLSVLSATASIRVAKKAPPGKAVIPRPATKTPVVQKTSINQVKLLAEATAKKKALDEKNRTWVQKLLGWFGLEKKK